MDVDKLLIIAVVAAFCLGPTRLVGHTKQLTTFLRQLRGWADTTKAQIEERTGVDIDWSELDPRRYDPRRIIRDALVDAPKPRDVALETPTTNAHEPPRTR
ncbi:hypothetical protein GCM10017714_34190 [Curtobacterium pusillum]|uniref:Sec-independent protein translocase TatB n=1 Tax=Curtobacterium pusillum TaxID=69373 RepID=A0ABX2MHT2_9MICO|nr:Sec-independent protein translocase TatB [Curtobacterium pusillum]NUU15126.1 Sec-independent protein translocase TatB [Curtobacterium pusillum]GLK31547.1 hypothetical protein GCM10017610_18320 [Curtobacterium pusillum]